MFGRLIGSVSLAALAGALMMGGASAQTNVKIGILGDRSGAYSDISGEGSVVAAKLAVEDFKPAEHGLKVEIVSADHQNKPDVGAGIARQWYDRDGVDMITDGVTSSVALAISQVTKEKNKVFIDTGAGTADLTGPQCTPNTIHWVYDTVALANGTGGAMVKRGGNTWFFLTADYVFGQTLQRDTSAVITKNGGRVIGSVKTPFPTSDFSSFLLQAQGSGAKVIGLANAGTDTINAIKQAGEFGITEGGQALAGLLVFSSDVHSLGTKVAQGLVLTEPFYWDLNDQTRAFSDRFAKQMKGNSKPTANHAGVYSDVLHYLKAMAELKSGADGAAVVAKMKSMPTDDPLFGKGTIRADGRKIHDMYLFEVKKPSESKGEWDLYNKLETIPGDQVFRPLNDGNCPLVKG
ncbi:MULTISPECIES: ABC transporter substrate-binding protein [unclassified Methylobacterium]|uniref:ABC transporter substrate-binding protein n=1 Tax=unclassified Methylobacterium TaxID=2615210 RepID=UPI0011C1E571|nr:MULTISPECIES: ABC transporter substrate-binding protein [unclassified Methylobacterium]QEE42582.1 ABC transporter substrate-binding protein [Methylobacterium sp. WL1]TXN56319.1 ABC transporter substrate-binding protein [Methylobacterium sp. WL2]